MSCSKTWLYVRRAHEKVVTPVVPEQPIEVRSLSVMSVCLSVCLSLSLFLFRHIYAPINVVAYLLRIFHLQIQHGDVLSIWNELSAMAEHIGWWAITIVPLLGHPLMSFVSLLHKPDSYRLTLAAWRVTIPQAAL